MTDMPNDPGEYGPIDAADEQPQPAPPQEVQDSVRLWFASMVATLIGGVLGYFLTDQAAAVQAVLDADPTGVSREQVQTAVTIGLVGGVLVVVLTLGFELFLVLKMQTGRTWARLVLAVLAAALVGSTVAGFARGVSTGAVINAISVLLLVAAVVQMFRPRANAYFRNRRLGDDLRAAHDD